MIVPAGSKGDESPKSTITPVFFPAPCHVTFAPVLMQTTPSFGKFGMFGITAAPCHRQRALPPERRASHPIHRCSQQYKVAQNADWYKRTFSLSCHSPRCHPPLPTTEATTNYTPSPEFSCDTSVAHRLPLGLGPPTPSGYTLEELYEILPVSSIVTRAATVLIHALSAFPIEYIHESPSIFAQFDLELSLLVNDKLRRGEQFARALAFVGVIQVEFAGGQVKCG
jgi:hypothetical protein